MRTEISTLFHLLQGRQQPVANAHIGDGLRISELDPAWIEDVRDQCPKVRAREELERQQPYTHRFYYEPKNPSDEFWDVSSREQQPLLRAVALSRLVKPTSIPYSNVWVRSTYKDDNSIHHFSEPVINSYSVAFGLKEHEYNTITEVDVNEMSKLWDSLSHFLDNRFEPTYRRIVRALKTFELAHGIYFADLRFPIIHAALESMICTTHKHNQAQVIQRLPQLVPFISIQQAKDIYLLCCDFKHAAQAMLQNSIEAGPITPKDQKRIDSVNLLHEAVRTLLLRALKDRTFADTLADVEVLSTTYQAFDSDQKLIRYKHEQTN
ncbi:MAG TPA: hypothetical protein VNO50_05835 [Pyrinomonadaceae bacterium]|nr:hypothetical protein [Pyrinomonadaceae bacterium]